MVLCWPLWIAVPVLHTSLVVHTRVALWSLHLLLTEPLGQSASDHFLVTALASQLHKQTLQTR